LDEKRCRAGALSISGLKDRLLKILSLPLHRINWLTSSFLIGTAFFTVIGLPIYFWFFDLNWFQAGMFFAFVALTGFSITAGYHRLFAHKTYEAKWPLRLLVLLFGASAFENSVLMWTSEHRRHHKHTDHEEDPSTPTSAGFFLNSIRNRLTITYAISTTIRSCAGNIVIFTCSLC